MTKSLICRRLEVFSTLPTKEKSTNKYFDLYSAYSEVVPRDTSSKINLRISFEQSKDEAILILGNPPSSWRNSLAIKGDIVGMGDELILNAYNHAHDEIEIIPHDKIAKICVIKVSGGDPTVVDELDDTKRGESGFGSTGM